MRIFLIYVVLLFATSCKGQNNQNLQSDIISFFKVSDQAIQNCKKESEELRKNKFDETTIQTIQDACIAGHEHLNFYRDNTLKVIQKTSGNKDFLIVNFISDNVMIPFDTKTILKIDNSYYGLKHYYDYINGKSVEKNEEFEVNKSDIENLQKIDEYLKTGKSEYVGNKMGSLIGSNIHWYVIKKNNGKIKMIELFRIK